MSTDGTAEPGKRERNKAEKRRRILAAARALFEANGFEATTTAQVSERAGVGTGTLYLYFESKEELLVEVFAAEVGRLWHDALDAVDRSESVLRQLVGAFGRVSDFHMKDPALSRAYFRELAFLPEDTRQAAIATMQKNYDRLEATLIDAQDDGRLRDDVPVSPLAWNIVAIWRHLMIRTFADHRSADEFRAGLETSFSVALLGLTTEG